MTEFVAPPLEGILHTSNPDNLIAAGSPIKAVFETFGKNGRIFLTLKDYYQKILWKGEVPGGNDKTELPFDHLRLGSGMFVLQAEFHVEGQKPYFEYYRFNVMHFLRNDHPTAPFFGTEARPIGRIPRGDDYARLMMQAGMGSTGYGAMYNQNPEFFHSLHRYRILNKVYTMAGHAGSIAGTPEDRKFVQDLVTKATHVTAKDEQRIEKLAFQLAQQYPEAKEWSFNHEEEGRSPILRAGRFDEWEKILLAFRRGVKRANPSALVLPDGETTNFHPGEKRSINEKYIQMGRSKGIRWEAFALHCYGSLDGTRSGSLSDLDEVFSSFFQMLNRNGYQREPVFCTEGFNLPGQNIPEWNCAMWNDSYLGGKASYDWGLREFNQAAWLARTYLIGLKYWPRLQRIDCWSSRFFLDYYLTPYAMMNAINTIGNLLPSPSFIGEIRPVPSVRGYVWKDGKGGAVAAIWCADIQVEDGITRGPEMQMTFVDPIPEFIDLMGNLRTCKVIPGQPVRIPLTAAPLFLRATSADNLLNALREAKVVGGSRNVLINVLPCPDGSVIADLRNRTTTPISGQFSWKEGSQKFSIPGNGMTVFQIRKPSAFPPGVEISLEETFRIETKDEGVQEKKWIMSYFAIPYCAGIPDWSSIPALPISRAYLKNGKTIRDKADFSAEWRAVWNEQKLLIRVDVMDDHFIPFPSEFWKEFPHYRSRLYLADGSLEVYFDCSANGRTSTQTGFDDDDYRFDFCCGNPEGKSGPGLVWRLREVHAQLAGGVAIPSKEEAAKAIRCQFIRTNNGYRYEIAFPARYLDPLRLSPGTRCGFALYLHDKDSAQERTGSKGLNTSSLPGTHCDQRPDVWPIMVLVR